MLIGCCGDQAVVQPPLGIYTNVGFDAKELLITFLALIHFQIELLIFILGRAVNLNNGGIFHGALDHHDVSLGQIAVSCL